MNQKLKKLSILLFAITFTNTAFACKTWNISLTKAVLKTEDSYSTLAFLNSLPNSDDERARGITVVHVLDGHSDKVALGLSQIPAHFEDQSEILVGRQAALRDTIEGMWAKKKVPVDGSPFEVCTNANDDYALSTDAYPNPSLRFNGWGNPDQLQFGNTPGLDLIHSWYHVRISIDGILRDDYYVNKTALDAINIFTFSGLNPAR